MDLVRLHVLGTEDKSGKSLLAVRRGMGAHTHLQKRVGSTVTEVAAEEAWKAREKEVLAFGFHLLLWKKHGKCRQGGVSCKCIGYDSHI